MMLGIVWAHIWSDVVHSQGLGLSTAWESGWWALTEWEVAARCKGRDTLWWWMMVVTLVVCLIHVHGFNDHMT